MINRSVSNKLFWILFFAFFSFQSDAQTIQPRDVEGYLQYDLEDALTRLNNDVAQSPESPKVLLRAAKFKQMMGFNTEAVEHLRQANKINPYAADLYGFNGLKNRLNVLHSMPNKYMQKLSFAQRMNYYYTSFHYIEVKEEENNTTYNLLNDAIRNIEEEELDTAIVLLDSILSRVPDSPIALDLKGVVFTKQQRYEEAVTILNRVVLNEPDFAIAWYNLGIALKGKKEYQKAKQSMDRAIELRSDLTKAYFERALVSNALENPTDALKDYDKIIDLKGKEYMEAYLNRGLTLKFLGDYNGALNDLNKVVKNTPDNAEVYKNRANLYLLFGRYEQSIKDFSKAILLNDGLAEAYHNRAVAYFIIHEDDKACMDLEKSNELGFELAVEKIKFFCHNEYE
ncbi:MAG: tetratricopeptide repeat protein [Chitinophagales bacterium]